MKDALHIFALISGLLIGGLFGSMHGQSLERGVIANECRTAGSFTFRRTGFECKVMR